MINGHNAQPPGRIIWTVKEVAVVIGWSTTRTRRWLKKERACTRHGTHYYVCEAQVRRAFFPAGDQIVAQLPE